MVFQERKYNWERWANGQAWKVIQNVDFTCYGRSFVGSVYRYATLTERAAVTSVFEYPHGNDVVFFWFYDADSLWKPNFKAFPQWRAERKRHARATNGYAR